MKSPFPGMDPYLEEYWGDVHTTMATYAHDQIQRQLPGDLRARVEEHLLISAENGHAHPRRRVSDIRIMDNPRGSQDAARADGAVATKPRIIRMIQTMPVQRSIRIIDSRSGNRLVTAIEILSPWNKAHPEGRADYKKKQSEIIDGGANLVEIDLLRVGEFIVRAVVGVLEDEDRKTYNVCVSRTSASDEVELYPISLRDSLPVIRLPLRESDSDVQLDMQSLIELVYANGAYDDLDYTKPTKPALSGDDAVWVDSLLREKGLR